MGLEQTQKQRKPLLTWAVVGTGADPLKAFA